MFLYMGFVYINGLLNITWDSIKSRDLLTQNLHFYDGYTHPVYTVKYYNIITALIKFKSACEDINSIWLK